jgi:hypothetical protein
MLHMAAHQTMEIMDPLSEAIAKQFPDKFSASGTTPGAAATAGGRDGQTLANQPAETQAMFRAVWGDRDGLTSKALEIATLALALVFRPGRDSRRITLKNGRQSSEQRKPA